MSYIIIPSLSCTLRDDAAVEPRPLHPHTEVQKEAACWQQMSGQANYAEVFANHEKTPLHFFYKNSDGVIVEPSGEERPREPNRLLELHGIMGSVGEQLMIAWAAEQDVQRIEMTADSRDVYATTLLGRAHVELSSHFLLAASHSLANLVLRFLLLDQLAVDAFANKFKRFDEKNFTPLSDNRKGWLTFNRNMVDLMEVGALVSKSNAMKQMVRLVSRYLDSSGYKNLDDRRGFDYHRWRPQSVPNTAPREPGGRVIDGEKKVLTILESKIEPKAELSLLHEVVVGAMNQVTELMQGLRRFIPTAISDMNIPCITHFPEVP